MFWTINGEHQNLHRTCYTRPSLLILLFLKNEDKDITTNQQIYGQIRNLMDTGAKKFRMEQDRVEQIKKMNEMREKLMKEKITEIN